MQVKLFKCLSLIFLAGLSNILPAAEQMKNVPYIVLRRSPRKKVLFMGTVVLSRSVSLSFLNNVQLTYVVPVNEEVRGKIIDSEGKSIREGDIIAKARNIKQQIIVNICTQKLKKMKVALQDARLNRLRIEKLYKRHVFSERQHEEAENEYLQAGSDYDVCRLELLEAKTNLNNMILRAPFSGVVEKVFAAAGSSLCDDKPILILSVFDPIYIKVKLHDVLTDLLCVNDKFNVYPTGFMQHYPGWLRTQEIFTSYIELSVKNYLLPKRKLTPEEEKLPKIYTQVRMIKIAEMPDIQLWVPTNAVKKDEEGSYIWIASKNASQKNSETTPVITVKKIRVKPKNMFVQRRSTQYQALETATKLKDSQIILVKTSDKLLDGGKAIMHDYSWLFQPQEKVWVSIPRLSKHIYIVSLDSLKTFEGRNFIFVIDTNNNVIPVDIFVYNRSGKTAEIIGKNLQPGMKIISSKANGKDYLGRKVKLGKKLSF